MASAAPHAEIEDRRPQAFQARLQTGGVDNMGGADAHALTALDAAA